jgi:hypothetical protein
MVCNNKTPKVEFGFNLCNALWTLLRGSFNAYVRSSLRVSSDLPGVNPATPNGIILYYHLMTKWSGLGDSTK